MYRLSRRTKIISIRVSDEEYTQLKQLCSSTGVDSISELARAAMKLLTLPQQNGSSNGNGAIEARMNEIHGRMTVLDREVGRLSSLMGLARLDGER